MNKNIEHNVPIVTSFLSYLLDERAFSVYTGRCYGVDLRQYLVWITEEQNLALDIPAESSAWQRYSQGEKDVAVQSRLPDEETLGADALARVPRLGEEIRSPRVWSSKSLRHHDRASPMSVASSAATGPLLQILPSGCGTIRVCTCTRSEPRVPSKLPYLGRQSPTCVG